LVRFFQWSLYSPLANERKKRSEEIFCVQRVAGVVISITMRDVTALLYVYK
jgi:hypothetical protein